MAVTTCKYHPKIPARWECHPCEISFCSDCVTIDSVKNNANCPLCKKPANQINASNFIVPFWNRIPKFFLYPANLSSLIFIIVITVLSSVIPIQLGILGLIIHLSLFLIFIKYNMAVLLHTSEGDLEPPSASIATLTADFIQPIKLILLFFIMFLSIYIVQKILGNAVAIFWSIFLFAGLPASIMLLAIDNALHRAINPLMIFNVMRTIGLPYIVLYIFLLLVLGGSGALREYFLNTDSFFLTALNQVLGYYFIVILFNMMGYLVFQYHDELGYSVSLHVDTDLESHQKKTNITTSPILNETDVLIKEGRLDDAAIAIEASIHQDPNNLKLHARYHELLKRTKNKEKLGLHGEKYMNILLVNNQTGKAANVYRVCLKANPKLAPTDPDKINKMAHTLHDLRAFKEAVILINGFHKRFPKHPDIPKNYLFAAKILSGELQQPKHALQIIQFLKSKYKDDPIYAQITQHADFLNDLMRDD